MKTATKDFNKIYFEKLIEKLSTWDIVSGVIRELYKRYDTEVWIIATCLEFVYIIWRAIGL